MAWSWNPRNWFRSDEQRAVSLQDVWGSGADVTSPGVRPVNMETALTLAPVYAASRLLADSVASLPLHTYREMGGTRRRIDTPELFADPSEFGTAYEWIQRCMTSLLLRGNAYGYITSFYADGDPRRIEWLHPDEVHITDNRAVRRPQWFWLGRPVDSDRMVHIPGYVLPGQVLGLSPIAAYAMTVETGLLSQQFGRDWFRHGVPSAVLETENQVSEEQANRIKQKFLASVDHRKPVVLGAGLSYKPISVKPNESQFLATMQATVNQIASIYGIPPEMIGGQREGSSLTYANVEQQSIDFATYTLRPYLTKLESSLSELLPRPQYVKFNVDAIIRADLKTRYEAHAIALDKGFKTVDEVRALEDLPPLPDGQGAVVRPQLPGTSDPVSRDDGSVRRLRLASGEEE